MPNDDHSELANPAPVPPLVQKMIAFGIPSTRCAWTLVCPPFCLMLTPDVAHTVAVAEAIHVCVTGFNAPTIVLPPAFSDVATSCHRLVAASPPRLVNLPAMAIVMSPGPLVIVTAGVVELLVAVVPF